MRARFADRLQVGAERVATVANATLGLAGAVAVLGGARWAVPTFTFCATPASVIFAGSDVVFADVGLDVVLNVQADVAEGLMPVAPFGAPPDVRRWSDSDRVVHDAAASLGNDVDLSLLPVGHAVVFSLHATKVLGSGEGGIVVFGAESNATRFREWTNSGFSNSRDSQFIGVNAKMSDVQAYYVHAALDGWHDERLDWIEAREQIKRMTDSVGLDLLSFGNGVNPYAIVELDHAAKASQIESVLGKHGVGTRRWWSMGCHRMPAYAEHNNSPYRSTDDIASRTLGLPMFRRITRNEVDAIGLALERACS